MLPITPNTLLTIKSDVLPPPSTFEEADIYARKHWRVVQQLVNKFWTRWRKQYLLYLQPRQKWVNKVPGIRVGISFCCVTTMWPLARVVECNLSHDSVVRSVKVLVDSKHTPKTLRKKSI